MTGSLDASRIERHMHWFTSMISQSLLWIAGMGQLLCTLEAASSMKFLILGGQQGNPCTACLTSMILQSSLWIAGMGQLLCILEATSSRKFLTILGLYRRCLCCGLLHCLVALIANTQNVAGKCNVSYHFEGVLLVNSAHHTT